MKGRERLGNVDSSTPRMERALPDLPMDKTVMVRLLRIAMTGMGDYFDPVFRAVDLTDNTFHVLCLLAAADGGSLSPTELSEMVGTSRPNMTRMVDELIEDGYVTRSTAVRDARRQLVAISTSGRKKVRDTVPRIAGPLDYAFSELSEKELAQLNLLLRKLIVSFDKGAVAMRSAA